MSLLLTLSLAAATQTTSAAADLPSLAQIPGSGERPVLFDEPGDGNVWALGANWKASFGPDGVLYVPITGRADVALAPVRFRLRGASLAGEELAIARAMDVRHDDDSVEMRHGALRQVWNVHPDQVEQTFVLDEMPQRGDLVLSIDVETQLDRRRVDRELLLESPAGAVRYGAAVAIDAAGRKVDVDRLPTPNGFELRVDESFLADVTLPLIVDPIVSNNFTVSASNLPQRRPDAAFGYRLSGASVGSGYLVVWEELAGGSDVDLLSVEVDEDGAVVPGTLGVVDASTFICQRPKVAFHRPEQMWQVVYERSVTNGVSWKIAGRRRELGSTSPYFQQTILSGVSQSSQRNPDIGGFESTTSTAGQGFTVVWEDDANGNWDIQGRIVSPTGSSITPVLQLTSAPEDDLEPDVSRGSGVEFFGFHWHNVVWTRDVDGPSPQAWSRRLTTDGIAMTGELRASLSTTTQDYALGVKATETFSGPAMDDGSLPFVSIFNAGFGGEQIKYSTTLGNSERVGGTNLSLYEGLERADDAQHLAVAGVGTGAMYAYSVADGSSFTLRASTGRLNYRASNLNHGLGLGERSILVAENLSGPTDFAVASRAEGGDFRDTGAVFWSSNGVVQGALFNAPGTFQNPILGVQHCNALPNSTGERGWLAAFGNVSPTGPKTIVAEDLPAGSFGYLLVGETTGNALVPGSEGRLCIGGSLGRYIPQLQAATAEGTMAYTVNPEVLPQPTGTVAAQPGENWYFQVWHRDAVNGVATSNFSNAMQITFE